MPEQVQRQTFHLLWCERCSNAAEPPKPFAAPDFAQPITEPMRCDDCGEFLHLLECFTAPQTTMWQAKPGATWQHVAYPEALPKQRSRQVWMSR